VPELPETETIARDLEGLARGLRVESVDVARPDVLRGTDASGLKRRLAGATITSVRRRAKTVCVALDSGDTLLVTPRFTGALQFDVPGDAYMALALRLAAGHTLAYRDVRRLGTVALVDRVGYDTFDRRLGREPLDPGFTGEALSGILRDSITPIKKSLMDQRRVAGVGNIYANESLWMAGIDPSRPSRSLSATECATLVAALRSVLTDSIAARGTTFRDYRDASGGRGGFAQSLRAYGRGGMSCPRCGTRLGETHAIDGRATVFCHRCQR
jgi:formamidopyrimidine-DNA glycosylase